MTDLNSVMKAKACSNIFGCSGWFCFNSTLSDSANFTWTTLASVWSLIPGRSVKKMHGCVMGRDWWNRFIVWFLSAINIQCQIYLGCVHASLYDELSVGWCVGSSGGPLFLHKQKWNVLSEESASTGQLSAFFTEASNRLDGFCLAFSKICKPIFNSSFEINLLSVTKIVIWKYKEIMFLNFIMHFALWQKKKFLLQIPWLSS